MARSKTREVLPLPANLTPDDRVCFCINIPDDPEHFAAFWGALNALGKRYSWGKPLSDDSETIAAYWMQIIQENRACFEEILAMTNRGCGCDGEPFTRYNSAGIRQSSTDGGVTFTDDLTDTRNYGSILPAPLWLINGGDNRCNGADTAKINIHNAIDQILQIGLTEGAAAVIGAIDAIMCTLTAGIACAVVGLITSMALALIESGATLIDEALTDEIYERFKCILFCHIGLDATFSVDQWQAVKADIQNQFTGDPRWVFWNFVNISGAAGLTALAQLSVSADGDCGACGCECGSPYVGSQGTSFVTRDDLGDGWYQVTCTDGGGGDPHFYAEILLTDCCRFVEYDISEGGTNAPGGNRLAQNCNGNPETGNYGVGQCVKDYILFRAYDAATFTFHLVCDEACGGDCIE